MGNGRRSKFHALLVCALFILATVTAGVIAYSQSIQINGPGMTQVGSEGVDLFNLQRERLGRQAAINRFNAAVALEKTMRTKRLTAPRPGAPTTFATTLASSQWNLIGPQPIEYYGGSHVSGRVTAIAVDPTNSSIAYLGAAEGGVWKTTDGGQHWTPLTDSQPSLAIGSIAIAPSNPSVIYVGTGEQNLTGDAYFGAGILKSTDGGGSWVNIPGAFVGARIGAISVNPQNSNIVLIGVLAQTAANIGVQLSTDGGMTWTPVLTGSPATAVEFDPTNGSIAYAALSSFWTGSGSPNGLFKSTDGGQTWTPEDGQGSNVLPSSTSWALTSLSISPSNPSTIYLGPAVYENGAFSPAVYKSVDGGTNWTNLSSAPNYCGQQCYYDNVVAVAPNDPNIVLLGGQSPPLYLSLDGGSNWSDITTDSSGSAIHPDMHAIAFSSDGSKMYVGSDGGVWSTSVSSSGVGTWTDLNDPLGITQFYLGQSINPVNPLIGFGGTQDNGVLKYTGALTWQTVACGDGNGTAIDFLNPGTVYAKCYEGYLNYIKSTANGDLGTWSALQVLPQASPPLSGNAPLGLSLDPLTMDPTNPSILYTAVPCGAGGVCVDQTTDGGNTWSIISPNLGPLSAISVSPSDPNVVYVASLSNLDIWVTTDAYAGPSSVWNQVATTPSWVNAIAVDPSNSPVAYLALGSTLPVVTQHVLKTTDGGASWTEIGSSLPSVAVNDVLIDPDVPNTLYVATDVGVFYTSDGGTTWSPLTNGLPQVAVMDLELYRPTRLLRASTHGRSMWELQLPSVPSPVSVSPSGLTFADTMVGSESASQLVTLNNGRTSPLTIYGITTGADYKDTNNCGTTLLGGKNCTINATFAPTTTGPLSEELTISDDAPGSPQTVSLTGTGTPPAVTLSTYALTFPNQSLNTTSASQTVTLTNSGASSVAISAVATTGDFAETNNCPGSLAASGSCSISVTFTPTATGTRMGTLSITDSAPGSPQMVSLLGTGAEPAVSLSASALTFASQTVNTTSPPWTVTLTNSGASDLTISGITTTGDFAETNNCPGSLAASASCGINITFTPTATGMRTGTLSIADNAPGSPQTVGLSGTGTAPTVTLSPNTLTFSSQTVNTTSAPQVVTLANLGTGNLMISGIATTGDFAETNNCPSSLAASASCAINITFTPTATGTRTGTLSVTDNAPGSPQTVGLSGTGTAPTVTFSANHLTFAGEDVGTSSAAQMETITNTGNASLTFSSISIIATNAGDFTIAPNGTTCSISAAVAPNSSCAIQVVFSPTAPGNRSASLSITDNAPGSPQTVSLSGSGMDFLLAVASGSSSSISVAAGGTASDSLTLTPEDGFNQAVSLACSGAPSKATCTVSPTSVTPDGTNPAQVTVNVTTTAASLAPPGPRGGPPPPGGFSVHEWWTALLLFLVLGSLALAFNERRRLVTLLAGAVLLAGIAMSCGGGGGGGSTVTTPGTPAGTYMLTVTGTSGSLQHSTTVTLVVK